MKIMLFCREINLVRINEDISPLEPRCDGAGKHHRSEIYFGSGYDAFRILLHEIYHFFIDRTGLDAQCEYTEEVSCDMHATFIDQLMLENGNDVFERLKRFAEGE